MPGVNTVAGPRQWACVDCYVMLCNGDPPNHEDAASWLADYQRGTRDQDITPGMLREYHDCRDAAGQTASDRGGECECETRTFSTDQCAICYTTLGGYRHAVTFWFPPNDTTIVDVFDFVPTRHADGTRDYSIWHGGPAPLNAGRGHDSSAARYRMHVYGALTGQRGRYIGRVHVRVRNDRNSEPGYNVAEYWATPDDGDHDWARLHWYGPFTMRKLAALWLTGYHAGRGTT